MGDEILKTLNEYVAQNRENISAVSIRDKWYGEMYSNTRAVFYDVPTINGKKSVFAFIGIPKTRKPAAGFPAVLLIHGGNGSAFYEMARLWAERGFVTIAPDFNGMYAHSINERQLVNPDGGNAGYGSIRDLHDDNTWAYFSVLSAMRAIDVLQDLNEVDKNNIFSCGLSWGGFVQLLLSSVDKRIKAASVIYSSAFVEQSEWGQIKLAGFEKDEDKKLWIDYIEPHNYLQNITHPIFFTAGTDDVAFKMESRRKTAESITAPTYFGLRKNFPHGNFIGFEQMETTQFFMDCVEDKIIPQPTVSLIGNEIRIMAGEKTSCLRLCYTKDNVDITDKQIWEEIVIGNEVLLPIPTSATALFIVEITVDGLQFSSNMIRI